MFTQVSSVRFSSVSFLSASVVAAAMFVPCAPSQAALTIDQSDIDDSGGQKTYTYTITASKMNNDGAQVIADMATYTNMELDVATGTKYFNAIGGQGNKTAGLSYIFDFSSLDLQVDTVQFRDTITVFKGGGENEDTIATTAYSTDGVNWSTITQFDSDGGSNGGTIGTGPTPPVITLPSPTSTVYYRVTFDSQEDGVGDDNQFTQDRNQWNRSGNNASTFQANFTLVPEPSSLSLIGIGAAACLGRGRRSWRGH